MKRKEYEKQLRGLQVELCALQDWVKHEGLRVVVVFEGRYAAGKGGTIKAITERVSPRVFRVVVLPAPSDREKGQLYLQRYVAHLPTAGEFGPHLRGAVWRAVGLGLAVVNARCTAPRGPARHTGITHRRQGAADDGLCGGDEAVHARNLEPLAEFQ